MPNIPGRPDLDDFVVNSARDHGIPIIIATITELMGIANGDPMVLGSVDGSAEVCVKLASREELREAIARAQAAQPYDLEPPSEELLTDQTKTISEVLRESNYR
jgi:hypothetical protein